MPRKLLRIRYIPSRKKQQNQFFNQLMNFICSYQGIRNSNLRSYAAKKITILITIFLLQFFLYIFKIKKEILNQQMRIIRIIVFLIASSFTVFGQITSSYNVKLQIFPQATFGPFTNSSSFYFPNDALRSVLFTLNHIYCLSTNNVVEIYNKQNPSIKQDTITNFFVPAPPKVIGLQSTPIYFMAFDTDYSFFVLTAFRYFVIRYIVFSISNVSLPQYSYTKEQFVFTRQPPRATFIANQMVCSLYTPFNDNMDRLYCMRLSNKLTFNITLPTQNASIAISPNGKIGILWNKFSQIFIYNITNNFSLLHTYTNSQITTFGKTNAVKFSPDSLLAVIQVDHYKNVDVINLTNFQSILKFQIQSQIFSVDYLDMGSRFILITCSTVTYLYDALYKITTKFNERIPASSVQVDQHSSQIILKNNSSFSLWGFNAKEDGFLAFGHQFNQNTSNINNTNTTNTTNSSNTINDSKSIPDKSNLNRSYSYPINLTEWQNQTFQTFDSASAIVDDLMVKFYVTVFSSPFICFFLGFLNYFTLNSLYVLLNIPLPQIVFKQLQVTFNSTNTNLLSYLNVQFTIPQISNQLVDSEKALYFGVSSDLLSINYYSFGLFTLNVILMELFIRVKSIFSQKIEQLFSPNRFEVYFGFFVSLIVANTLPWKYVSFNNGLYYMTKINSFCFHILFIFLLLFATGSIVYFFQQKAPQRCKKGKNSEQIYDLYEWMIALQNFFYSFFVLFPNPLYFLITIFISKIFQIKIFLKSTQNGTVSKILQMGIFICEFIYHLTFFIFFLAKDQKVIIYNSMVCIGIFLLGAILNFLLVIVIILLSIYKFLKEAGILKKIHGVKRSIQKARKIRPIQQKKQTIARFVLERKVQNMIVRQPARIQKVSKFKKAIPFQDVNVRLRAGRRIHFQLKYQQK